MQTSSKNKLFITLAILVVLVAGGLFLSKGDSDDSITDETVSEVNGDEITVSGAIYCLPYRISIDGQSCVKGIKGDDGKVYALNSPKGLENTMNEGAKVTAVGVFQPAVTSIDDSSAFIYDGVLVVRTLQKR